MHTFMDTNRTGSTVVNFAANTAVVAAAGFALAKVANVAFPALGINAKIASAITMISKISIGLGTGTALAGALVLALMVRSVLNAAGGSGSN